MIVPSEQKAMEYGKMYHIYPVCREVMADELTPIQILKQLATLDQHFFLLESVEKGRMSRYSYLGYRPKMCITCKDGIVTLEENGKSRALEGSPKEALRKLMKEYTAPRIEGLPTFTGGLVGYFGYEMIQYAEPKLRIRQSECNDCELMMFDKIIAFDQIRHKVCFIVNVNASDGIEGYRNAVQDIDHLVQELLSKNSSSSDKHEQVDRYIRPESETEFVCNTTKEKYCEMVERTKQYIREGDIFQAVISRKFNATYEKSLMNAYRILRSTNPSPYMYFIQNKEMQIMGSSPETMVKLEDGKITTFPVAGSRPRGKDATEDKKLEQELLVDEKELAEHNMLVDLARNDVGRLAQAGSVEVRDYKAVHRFSKIMHLASTVVGTIREDRDGWDTIEAMLPAGTLSGAPKFRACQIIDELEEESREVYGGAIGYIDYSGNLDMCIAIRTAVKKDNQVCVQAGAGIVADSIPETEYQECANKAGAVIDAIQRAGEVDNL